MSAGWAPSRDVRTLAVSQFTNSLGDGAYYVTSVLYFVTVVGLSPTQVGVGLSFAWGLGFLCATPLGHLGDRLGLRGTAIALAFTTAAGLGLLMTVRSMTGFVVAVTIYAIAQSGLGAVRQALVVKLVSERDRVRARARLQVMLNAGLGLGAAVGGLALAFGSADAYRAVLACDTVAFAVAGLLLGRLPAAPHARSEPVWSGSLAVLRDRPFVIAAALNAVLYVYMPLMSVLLPLWIAERTAAPNWTAATVFVLSTVGVVAMQGGVARRVTGLISAARAVRRGGSLLGVACLVLAAAGGVDDAGVATLLIMLGAVVLVSGEVFVAAGSWSVSFDLSDVDRPGQWQGFFSSGIPVARAVGPVVLLALVMDWSDAGWVVVGFGFFAAGFGLAHVARRADRHARLGTLAGDGRNDASAGSGRRARISDPVAVAGVRGRRRRSSGYLPNVRDRRTSHQVRQRKARQQCVS